MTPTYDGNGNRRSAKNDPTAGGKSFREQQKEKKARAKSGGTPESLTKLRPTSKTCKVCQSQYRDQVEKLIVRGMPQSEVIAHMEQIGEKFNKNSMSNHVRKHMTMGDAVVRRVLEKQAEKHFENVEEVAETLLTNRAMLEIMRDKAFKAIISNDVSIEPETALRIIDKLEADDANTYQDRVDEMVMEMNILTRTMKQIVPESMWKTIADQFSTNLEIERARRKQLGRGD